MKEKQKKTQKIILKDEIEKATAKTAEKTLDGANEKANGKALSGEAKAIKERLCSELRNSGLTAAEISAKIGVSPEMVTQYMTTDKMPRLETFARICKELDISPAYVLGVADY